MYYMHKFVEAKQHLLYRLEDVYTRILHSPREQIYIPSNILTTYAQLIPEVLTSLTGGIPKLSLSV
jgi:hypothetical protein